MILHTSLNLLLGLGKFSAQHAHSLSLTQHPRKTPKQGIIRTYIISIYYTNSFAALAVLAQNG